MLDTFRVTHTADESITATLTRPSRAAFAEWWDAYVAAKGKPTYDANLNLLIACRVAPSPGEFAALLAEEWSTLPNDTANLLSASAGLFGTGEAPNERTSTGEIVDLRALAGNVSHIKEPAQKEALARAEHHRAAMLAAGITEGQLALWFGVRNPHITRLCVALPWGGYFAARAPSAAERAHASDVHNGGAEDAGPFEAKAVIVASCALWPGKEQLAAMLSERPGAAVKLGAMVEALGGGYRVELGK